MDGHLEMPKGAKTATATNFLQVELVDSINIKKCENGYILRTHGTVVGTSVTMVATSFEDAIEIMARWMGER